MNGQKISSLQLCEKAVQWRQGVHIWLPVICLSSFFPPKNKPA